LVEVWRLGGPNRPADRIRTPGTVEDLAFTPDGSRLVISTGWADGGYFVAWDSATQKILKSVPADDVAVWSADVSNDGRTLITGGGTAIVRLWDLPTGTSLGAPLTALVGAADTVDLSPDGSTAVGADTSNRLDRPFTSNVIFTCSGVVPRRTLIPTVRPGNALWRVWHIASSRSWLSFCPTSLCRSSRVIRSRLV
jgi:hypothetical protein